MASAFLMSGGILSKELLICSQPACGRHTHPVMLIAAQAHPSASPLFPKLLTQPFLTWNPKGPPSKVPHCPCPPDRGHTPRYFRAGTRLPPKLTPFYAKYSAPFIIINRTLFQTLLAMATFLWILIFLTQRSGRKRQKLRILKPCARSVTCIFIFNSYCNPIHIIITICK